MKFVLSLALVAMMPFIAQSQQIEGLWKGTIQNDSTQHILQYEILISKEKGKYTGYSHTWFLINEKKYYGIKKIKVQVAKDGKIVLLDESLLENNYPIPANANVRQLNVLDLITKGEEQEMNGIFETNRTKEFMPLTGRTLLQKVAIPAGSELVDYLERKKKINNFTAANK